jgi:hypothetical protein
VSYVDSHGRPVTLEVNRTYSVSLAYDPAAAGGAGQLTLSVAGVGVVGALPLHEGDRADGATMNRFGVWGQQIRAGDDALSPFLDDVQIDGGPAETFTTGAPGWEALGVMGRRFLDCENRPAQNFGWSRHGPGSRPAIGGLIWRDEDRRAYYADVLPRRLTLADELYAEGSFTVEGATSDSGLLLGWFRHDIEQDAHFLPAQTVAMAFTGLSRLGYFVEPEYRAGQGLGRREAYTLPASPTSSRRHFVLHYLPGRPNGPGRLTLTVDGRSETIAVPVAAKREGAGFDRFGIRDLQVGGNSQRVWFDRLTYTFRPGVPPRPALPAPRARAAPRIAGRARVGQVLKAVRGRWRGRRLKVRRRWERCTPDGRTCGRIAGAIHTRYRVGRSDAGFRLRVVETASNRTTDQVAPSRPTRVVQHT